MRASRVRQGVAIVVPPPRPGLMPVRHVTVRGGATTDREGVYAAAAELVYHQWSRSPLNRAADREDIGDDD